jgi:hypothetical protein
MKMTVAHQADDEQTTLWNGLAGRAWVEAQELLDGIFKPLGAEVRFTAAGWLVNARAPSVSAATKEAANA